jgi:hypothetical protein
MPSDSARTVRCALCGRTKQLKGTRVKRLEAPTLYRRPIGTTVELQPGDFVCVLHSTAAELDALPPSPSAA